MSSKSCSDDAASSAIRELAQAGLAGSKYWIVGNGPERSRLEALARALGVIERTGFVGSLSREATPERLAYDRPLLPGPPTRP